MSAGIVSSWCSSALKTEAVFRPEVPLVSGRVGVALAIKSPPAARTRHQVDALEQLVARLSHRRAAVVKDQEVLETFNIDAGVIGFELENFQSGDVGEDVEV